MVGRGRLAARALEIHLGATLAAFVNAGKSSDPVANRVLGNGAACVTRTRGPRITKRQNTFSKQCIRMIGDARKCALGQGFVAAGNLRGSALSRIGVNYRAMQNLQPRSNREAGTNEPSAIVRFAPIADMPSGPIA